MSLLRRLEHGGASLATADARAPGSGEQTPLAAKTEPVSRSLPAQSQATEAQRSLKERVKRKLISELDPKMDTTQIVEVRQRLKILFDQIIEAENLVLTRTEK